MTHAALRGTAASRIAAVRPVRHGFAAFCLAALCLVALCGAPARAQGPATIHIGVILSVTGPTAAQGVGYRNAVALLPVHVAGQEVAYLVRDDANDPASAVSIARKLIAEDHVDAFIGPASNATCQSVLPVAAEAHVPAICMSPLPIDGQVQPYAFDDAQPSALMVEGVVRLMEQRHQDGIAFIGYSDGWGDQMLAALQKDVAGTPVRIVDEERYARTDGSAMPQVLHALSHHPDGIMLGGSATPGALPSLALAQRGWKGQVYNNHGVVSPEYIKVGGTAVEGVIAPTGPLVVYDQLPDANPVKPVATAFMQRYQERYGPGARSAFAGYTYDAMLILAAAVPDALKAGAPGTTAFREALRDAMEHVHDLVGTHGVYDMTPVNHNGMDARARVMVQVHDARWVLLQP